jgi:hypothetical protein
VKNHSQVLLDRTGAPENCWLLACEYIADVHNVCADESLGYRIPREVRHGGLQDISAFLEFRFYEPVLYLDSDETFPSTKEKPGWWVGVAHNIGDALTYKILTEDTHKVVHRSVVHLAKDDRFKNKRVRFEPDSEPVSTGADDAITDESMLQLGRRRLKIDQGLSRQKKRKQVCRQACRPRSVSPEGHCSQSTTASSPTEPAVNGGEIESELEPQKKDETGNTKRSRVFDVIDMEDDVEIPNVMEGGGNRGPSLDADDRGISLAADDRGASLDAMDGDTGLTDSTDASNGDVECKQPVR